MTSSFDGNDGNDGNAGNAGNATSTTTGWFFADRVDLPLVTASDSGLYSPSIATEIGSLRFNGLSHFPARNWSAEWYSWLALNEFATTSWQTMDPTAPPSTIVPSTSPVQGGVPIVSPWPWPTFVPALPVDWAALSAAAQLVVQAELNDLVTAASTERADALGEILSQADEFASYFLNMLTARPGAYPATTKVLAIASLIGTFVAMYFKQKYARPRPSQLCPALLPPVEVPGHASFPSGHSTQAHLMVLCLGDVFAGVSTTTPAQTSLLPQRQSTIDDLWTLANRIARNREIAGLHYPSDSAAGIAIAYWTHYFLTDPTQASYLAAVARAHDEWVPS